MARRQAYEFTGVIHRILRKETFASGFEKRTVILRDDGDDGGKYQRYAAFDFLHGTGSASSDLTKLVEGFSEGETVTVSFFTEAHESKKKKDAWFSANCAVRMERVAGTSVVSGASAVRDIIPDTHTRDDGGLPL